MRLRVHPLTPLMLALIYVLSGGQALIPSLIALGAHESAHLLLALRLHARVDEIELMPFGAAIRLYELWETSPGALVAIALAGPGMNLAAASLLALGLCACARADVVFSEVMASTATFVGQKQKSIPGGIVATLGLVFPSIVIILVIAAFLQNFADLPVVIHAFAGVRACVCALILSSVLKLRKSSLVDGPTAVIFAVVLVLASYSYWRG